MGFFQRLFGALGMSSQACKILVVGLDDAGKTTIMNQIMPKKVRAPPQQRPP
jgi:GTPase SAR1 family protein